jgi:hypothetical protein
MGTSGNKWPVNSKEIVSAIHPNPPILLSVTIDSNSVFLEWESGNSDCYPVQEFYVYDNDVIIKKVPFPNLSTEVTDLFNCTTNVFYITAVIYKTQSDPSNSLSAFIDLPYGPTITYYDSTCDGGITLIWEMKDTVCLTIDYYNVYEVGTGIIGTSTATTFNVLKTDCKSYSFYVTAVFLGGSESIQSQTVTVTQQPCAPVLSSSNLTNTTVNINWSEPSSTCDILSYDLYKVYNGSTVITNVSGPSPYSYLVTNLLQDETYTFFAYSKGVSVNSVKSNTVTVITPPNTLPLAPNITGVTYSYKQATLSWTNTDPTVTGYKLYIGATFVGSTSSLSYTYTSLVNGSTYLLGVSAINSIGTSPTSTINAMLPTTQTYFGVSGPSGQVTQTVTSSDYIVTFTAGPGVVTCVYNVNINCNLTMVGGGGGGAAGNNSRAGGGGAGAQVLINQPIVFQQYDSANVTSVGNGGIGGTYGFDGATGGSSIVNFMSTTYTALGGGGGFSGSSSGGTGLGGNGGNGATIAGSDGGSGYNGTNGYSGGGGGGAYKPVTGTTVGSGGVGGLNGIGGAGGSAVNTFFSPNGFSATTTGSGGGGGNQFDGDLGGNGFRGIVIFTIPN